MSEPDGDEFWVDSENDDGEASDESKSEPSPHKETASEARVINDLANRGVNLARIHANTLEFSCHSKWGASHSRRLHLPRDMVPALLAQLENGVEHCTEFAGITIPSEGYVEVLISPNQAVGSRFLDIRLRRLAVEEGGECANGCASGSVPALDFLRGFDEPLPVLALHGPEACMQISGPSPACHVLANFGLGSRPRYGQSIRVFQKNPASRQKLEELAQPLLNSLMYELDVRNRINVRPVRWPSQFERRHPVSVDPATTKLRYPETKVDPDVSVLFGFAGSATGNPSLAFLSYYQVLESYFSIAMQRNVLSLLRAELSDPMFDRRQDKSLQRVIALGERAAAASEIVQLKTLLADFVREDKLYDFFDGFDWGNHFTKAGPILGMTDNVNIKNKQTPLSAQVAERVYRIRNRIVHSKDDPKYEGAPALLPQSEEAEALWPDILLARLLCREVILSVQNRGL